MPIESMRGWSYIKFIVGSPANPRPQNQGSSWEMSSDSMLNCILKKMIWSGVRFLPDNRKRKDTQKKRLST